jgi:hypothetical protein
LYIFNFAAQQIVAGNAYWTPPSSPGAPDAAFLNSTLGIAAEVIGFMFREFVVRLVQFAFKLLRSASDRGVSDFILFMIQVAMPNKSPEPTASIAVSGSQEVWVCIDSGARWLSFFR